MGKEKSDYAQPTFWWFWWLFETNNIRTGQYLLSSKLLYLGEGEKESNAAQLGEHGGELPVAGEAQAQPHDGVQRVRLHRHRNQTNPKDRSFLAMFTSISVIFIYLNFEEGCLLKEKKKTTGVADPWHFYADPDPRIHASD